MTKTTSRLAGEFAVNFIRKRVGQKDHLDFFRKVILLRVLRRHQLLN